MSNERAPSGALFVCLPSMFDSLEVKVLYPQSDGDEGLVKRKGVAVRRSERSAEQTDKPGIQGVCPKRLSSSSDLTWTRRNNILVTDL